MLQDITILALLRNLGATRANKCSIFEISVFTRSCELSQRESIKNKETKGFVVEIESESGPEGRGQS